MKKHILTAILMLTALSLSAQEKAMVSNDNSQTVKGRVVDAATGQPLAGVIVSAYGNLRQTTMTGDDGCYELNVPGHVRSIAMRVDGYNMQQAAISDGRADAKLYRDFFSQDYNATTTANLSAEAGNFSNTSEMNIDPLISQQLAAHVRSVSRGGIPGMGNTMLISGINSLNINAQPLVVVDDVIMDMQYGRQMLHDGYFNNILANLNVNDIESVQVLKNGTALYGAKGANGIVLIKTKRNK